MTDIRSIPLNQLEISPLNARQTRTPEAIEAMAASLLAHGQIQNVVVHPTKGERFGVAIGGTRLEGWRLLVKQKKISADHLVTAELRPANDPTLAEQSLAENVVRSRMHPADEFESFAKLAAEGHGPAEIGSRFGQTARYVQQRMKLAAVSPKLLAIFRMGEMNLDQLEAFTIETDTKRQEKAWKSLPDWQRERGGGEAIRKALTEQQIETDDRRVKFVGLDAYKQAGGSVIADLFDRDPDAGYLTDAALLDKLVAEKLEAEAAKLTGEGWKWSRALPAIAYEEEQKYQRLYAQHADPSEEAKAEIAKLEEEAVALQEEHGEQPEDVAAANRLDEISDRYNELGEGEAIWSDEQKAIAGAIITIGHGGEIDIRRGMVKPEDRKAAQALTRGGKGTPAKAEKPKSGIPAALVLELTAHKTVAAQLVLSGNPAVALKVVTHALALQMFYPASYGDSSLEIKAHGATYPLAVREALAKTEPAKKLAGVVKGWKAKLPKKSEQLWTWIDRQQPATVQKLLAVCAALTVNLVQNKDPEPTQAAVELTTAIKLNMADHFSASADNYFTRVSKKTLMAELGTAVSATVKRQMEGMKREAIGKALQNELRNKKWLPQILRQG